ncbi:hypothetical protein A2U01_0029235 [Trifolium medium]|uniref:Uncharacterized protein n=1 Tax=Trifolium medium TaxID=97028 RepID=A0A392P9P7_9FABA|nr:hypothetical protein [Trifolium medium]
MSEGVDLIEGMIYHRSAISARLFRVLGSEIAEVPMGATSLKHDDKGV